MTKENELLRQEITTSINVLMDSLKDKISADILNLELATLYSNRIYEPGASSIQELTTKLSDNIDAVLDERMNNCIEDIGIVFKEFSQELKKTLSINAEDHKVGSA